MGIVENRLDKDWKQRVGLFLKKTKKPKKLTRLKEEYNSFQISEVTWKGELAYPLFSQLCRRGARRRIYQEAEFG